MFVIVFTTILSVKIVHQMIMFTTFCKRTCMKNKNANESRYNCCECMDMWFVFHLTLTIAAWSLIYILHGIPNFVFILKNILFWYTMSAVYSLFSPFLIVFLKKQKRESILCPQHKKWNLKQNVKKLICKYTTFTYMF